MGLHTGAPRAKQKVELKGKVLEEFDYSLDDALLQNRRTNWTIKSHALFYLLKAAKKLNESAASVTKGIASRTGVKTGAEATGFGQQQHKESILVSVDLKQVEAVSKHIGSKSESRNFTIGTLLFGGLLFACGAVPWALPGLYLLFAAICLPPRVYYFCTRKWTFFLVDFCYFANMITIVYLLWLPNNALVENVVFAITDGPLAAAVIVWQCAWVFGSYDHAISVLIHVMPGLAVFAQRHYTTPQGWRGWLDVVLSATVGGTSTTDITRLGTARKDAYVVCDFLQSFLWLFVLPMAFYMLWQITYFLIVQVCFRGFILKNGYDTSYNCLARRAAKTNNIWNRLVRRGSVGYRCMMYGILQLTFTVISLLCFQPIYHVKGLSVLWQVVKVGVSVYYGAQHQCEKLPRRHFMEGIKQLQRQQSDQQQDEYEYVNSVPTAVTATGAATVKRRSRKALAH